MSVFVVFPEPVEQLRKFADDFGITMSLLADPDSRIITELGILNTTLDESDAPFFGIPYPGSYVVESDGCVSAKFFEQNSLVRAHPQNLLRAAQGIAVHETAAPSAEPVAHVEAQVSLGAGSLRTMLVTDLFVDLRVPPGQHLYGPPVSEGLVVTSVVVDNSKQVTAHPAVFPPTQPLTLKGTGETLHVYEGDVRVQVPVIYNGRRATAHDDGSQTVDITGTIRWQSCDDQSCHLPRTETFSHTVQVEPPNVPQRLSDRAPAE